MTGFILYGDPDQVKPLLPYAGMSHGTWQELNVHNRITDHLPSPVFQWGTPTIYQGETSAYLLNGAEGIHNCSDQEIMKNILSINGIPSLIKKKEMMVRRYFVLVFEHEIIGLYRSNAKMAWIHPGAIPTSDRYVEISTRSNQRELKRVMKYATRSIYVLGLDFGGVLAGITPSGKIKILHVTPAPRLNETIARNMAQKFNQYVTLYSDHRSEQKREQAILGADPEFVLRRAQNGEIILASTFFNKTGRVGCDAIWLREDRTRNQLPLAELRPRPDQSPRQLVINIYKAMLQGIKKINEPDIEWLAGGMPMKGYPIGGHIHFSQVWLHNRFLRCLDNYLALPLVLVESRESIQRRPKYGFLGDIRQQFHGGFEYRTLPSWLMSPRLTKGVIAMAKLLSVEYMSLFDFPLLHADIQEAFYQGDKETLKPVVAKLLYQVKNLKNYPRFASYLDPFCEHVLSGEEWDEYQDIRVVWKLPPYHRLTSRL
ncbi:MAG: hypothetical protein H0Z33_03405 [Bacillaceae bacterium]|nr:hypothetical protein [Bacillaceae bacterium]